MRRGRMLEFPKDKSLHLQYQALRRSYSYIHVLETDSLTRHRVYTKGKNEGREVSSHIIFIND